MYASERSELRKCWHFYILKLLFLSTFCRYIRHFVGTNDMLVGLHVPTNFQMYRQNSEKHYCPPPPGYANEGRPYTGLSLQCDAVVFTILSHLSLSSAALTASCSVISVELLMSLSHDIGRWAHFLFPFTFPVMIVLSSPFELHFQRNATFHLRTISRSMSLFLILFTPMRWFSFLFVVFLGPFCSITFLCLLHRPWLASMYLWGRQWPIAPSAWDSSWPFDSSRCCPFYLLPPSP